MKYDISALGNALVDTQYMVDHDFLKDICLNTKTNNKKIDLKINKKIINSGRPIQLKRCFVNLIDNALRYAEKIIVELNTDDENIIININDNGPGIHKINMMKFLNLFLHLIHHVTNSKARVDLD